MGQPVPEGVYFYVINYRRATDPDKEAVRSGSVTLFR